MSLLSRIGSTLSSIGSSFLSKIGESNKPSSSLLTRQLPKNVVTMKANSQSLGFGDLAPQVYHEPSKPGEYHYVSSSAPIERADSLAIDVSKYLSSHGTPVSTSKVMEVLGKLKVPALGALGVAAVAGLVLGAMKLYDKFKQNQQNQQNKQKVGSGLVSC